ncbi:MAG: RsmB/NOP family class I SAM-dependent RNA methyltransferase [Chlorobi bacterium CHB2]|nr:RsmB/NOP family class I SAM-dependent RNA methyltransferase [Chlorobi bacterium CHB2]
MSPVSLIGHCRELLESVLSTPRRPADKTISQFFRDRRYLGARDRGFISDVVYSTLRGVLRVRALCAGVLERKSPDREARIQLAAALLSPGNPSHQLSIADIRDGARLTNEQVAEIQQSMETATAKIGAMEEPERSAVEFGLPEWFAFRMLEQFGQEGGRKVMESLNQQAPITLRCNRLKGDRDALRQLLAKQGIPSTPGLYSPDALLLERRMNANAIPEFKEGWFELQDEGSQMLSVLLDPRPNWQVFDACAGAGGKTLHLAAIMKGRGAVVAHDVNNRRLEEIRPRLRRNNAQNVRVMEHRAFLFRREELRGTFNAVVIDAPCSGTGTLRRNPGARLMLEESMVERVAQLQAEILDEYSELVAPNGLLMYATCSLLREENQAQVEEFLRRRNGWELQAINAPQGMLDSDGYFCAIPDRHGTDGFFAAVLKRVR